MTSSALPSAEMLANDIEQVHPHSSLLRTYSRSRKRTRTVCTIDEEQEDIDPIPLASHKRLTIRSQSFTQDNAVVLNFTEYAKDDTHMTLADRQPRMQQGEKKASTQIEQFRYWMYNLGRNAQPETSLGVRSPTNLYQDCSDTEAESDEREQSCHEQNEAIKTMRHAIEQDWYHLHIQNRKQFELKMHRLAAQSLDLRTAIRSRGTTRQVDAKGEITFELYACPEQQVTSAENFSALVLRAVRMLWGEYGDRPLTRLCCEKDATNIFLSSISALGLKVMASLLKDDSSKALSDLLLRQQYHTEDEIMQNYVTGEARAGIYLSYGSSRSDTIDFLYVGKSENVHRRMLEHLERINEKYPEATHTHHLHYWLAKRSSNVNYVILSETSRPSDITQQRKENGVSEAIWSALLASCKICSRFLSTRAQYGLPKIDISGANSTLCLDGVGKDIGPTDKSVPLNASLVPLRRQLLGMQVRRYQYKLLVSCKKRQKMRLVHKISGGDLSALEGALERKQRTYDTLVARHLQSGHFQTALISTIGGQFEMRELGRKKIPMKAQRILNLDQDTPAFLYVKLEATQTTSNDTFQLLTAREQKLYQGIQMTVFTPDASKSAVVQFTKALQDSRVNLCLAQKCLDWLDFVQPGIREERKSQASLIQYHNIPKMLPRYAAVDAFLNGSCSIYYEKNEKRFILWWSEDGEGKKGMFKFAARHLYNLLSSRDMPRSFVRLNFNASTPFLAQGLSGEDRQLLSNTSLEILSFDGKWIPINWTLRAKAPQLQSIFTAATKFAISARLTGSINQVQLSGFRRLEKPPKDYDGEPGLFRCATRLLSSRHGKFSVVSFNFLDAHKQRHKYPFGLHYSALCSLFPPDGPTEDNRTLDIKLDGWKKSAEDARLLLSNPKGCKELVWYDHTSLRALSPAEVAFLQAAPRFENSN